MNHIRVSLLAAGLAAVALATSPAWSHGDEPHGTSTVESEHAAALGQPGDPTKISRTIDVEMTDQMRFSPASIDVRRGETVRFRVKNAGQVKHEMVLGTLKELKEHAALMQRFPEMEHSDPNQASVDPGKTGELVWHFTRAGKFEFACLQPGHFEAGMKGVVTVKR